MTSLVTSGAPISAVPLHQACATSDMPAESQVAHSAGLDLVPTEAQTAAAIDSLDDILAELDASEKKSEENVDEPRKSEEQSAVPAIPSEVQQEATLESVDAMLTNIDKQEKHLEQAMTGLRMTLGANTPASGAEPSTSMGSTFQSLSDLVPEQRDQGIADQERAVSSPAPESVPAGPTKSQVSPAESQSDDSGDSYSSPSDPHPPSPRKKKQKTDDSDKEYEGEESNEAEEEAGTSTSSSDTEANSPEPQEHNSEASQLSLEEKYATILAKAARTNTQEMKFLSAATLKKLQRQMLLWLQWN